MGPLLERAGLAGTVREEALEARRAANEDPAGFSVLSRYRVLEVRA